MSAFEVVPETLASVKIKEFSFFVHSFAKS